VDSGATPAAVLEVNAGGPVTSDGDAEVLAPLLVKVLAPMMVEILVTGGGKGIGTDDGGYSGTK